MAEIHSFPSRFDHEGAERLAGALERALTADADPGPRWPQIQTLGLLLQQSSRDLRREVERISSERDVTPETKVFRESFLQLAAAFTRLGVHAAYYQTKT